MYFCCPLSEIVSQNVGDDEYGNYYSEPAPKLRMTQRSPANGGIKFPPIYPVSKLDRVSDY